MIQFVYEYVKEMDRVNISNEKYNFFYLLFLQYVSVIVNLFGCSVYCRINNCFDMCFYFKYCMIDGICNNLQYFMWGVLLIFFKCLLSFVYENGYNMLVGWQDMEGCLSVCFVFIELVLFKEVSEDEKFIYMLMQWG